MARRSLRSEQNGASEETAMPEKHGNATHENHIVLLRRPARLNGQRILRHLELTQLRVHQVDDAISMVVAQHERPGKAAPQQRADMMYDYLFICIDIKYTNTSTS